MSTSRILGLVLLAVGVALLLFGLNASRSMSDRIVEGFTGYFTNRTMWYLFGGIVAMVAGAAMAIWGGRRVSR